MNSTFILNNSCKILHAEGAPPIDPKIIGQSFCKAFPDISTAGNIQNYVNQALVTHNNVSEYFDYLNQQYVYACYVNINPIEDYVELYLEISKALTLKHLTYPEQSNQSEAMAKLYRVVRRLSTPQIRMLTSLIRCHFFSDVSSEDGQDDEEP